MPDLARCLRRLVTAAGSESDADLLGRFVTARDEQAVAELVRRHGPMVFAVCRRVLGHRHDAEDAFQATFLVLARRAGSLRPRSALGSWLYGVAYRTALGARRVALARKAREAKAGAMRESETTPDSGFPADLLAALDRELAALPVIYRAAVVACELQGLSRREAAVRLGVSEGTLSSRLARARFLLARRLKRSGLAVPAAGLAGVVGPSAVAKSLTDSTIRLGTLVAAGEAAVSTPVAALMEGTMKAMLLAKLKTTATALVVGCAVVVTATAGWQANAAGNAAAQDRGKPAADKRKTSRDQDKERIRELEREREKLLKELAELRDRLTVLERAQQLAAAKAALDTEVARLASEEKRKWAVDELRKLRPEGSPAAPTAPATWNPPRLAPPAGTSASSPSVRPATTEPLRPPAVAAAPANSFPRSAPLPGTTVEPSPPPATRPATTEPTRPPAGSPAPATEGAPEPARPPVARPGGTIPPLPPAPAKAATTVKVYPVIGLAWDEKEGGALAKVVKAVVEPQSWGTDAGVEYLPGRQVLVVRQTDKGHQEVAKLLEMLKKVEPAGRW